LLDRPRSYEGHDLLRRLEEEVGPMADAALTRPKPRPVLLRALLRTAIAAAAMAAIVIAWQQLPTDSQTTETTGVQNSHADEVSRLRTALEESEAAQRRLERDLDLAREELRSRKQISPGAWHEDPDLLLYRSPWRARWSVKFVARRGLAPEHCGADNGSLIVDSVTDWMAEKLGASPEGL
jgi:hypothetical protein